MFGLTKVEIEIQQLKDSHDLDNEVFQIIKKGTNKKSRQSNESILNKHKLTGNG